MGDALAELGIGRELVAEMDRVGIAGQLGEKCHVSLHHRAHQAFALADRQILESMNRVERPGHRLNRH